MIVGKKNIYGEITLGISDPQVSPGKEDQGVQGCIERDGAYRRFLSDHGYYSVGSRAYTVSCNVQCVPSRMV